MGNYFALRVFCLRPPCDDRSVIRGSREWVSFIIDQPSCAVQLDEKFEDLAYGPPILFHGKVRIPQLGSCCENRAKHDIATPQGTREYIFDFPMFATCIRELSIDRDYYPVPFFEYRRRSVASTLLTTLNPFNPVQPP